MSSLSRRAPYKILIIDDSHLCRSLTKHALESAGFDVIAVGTPIGFSLGMSNDRPDLALVDVTMPALSGDQLVLLARGRLGSLCPIILYSERTDEELSRLAKQCGAAGYIRKSSDWVNFTASISQLCRQLVPTGS